MLSWSRQRKEELKRFTVVRHVLDARARLRKLVLPFAPAGHFYSPIPSLANVQADADRLFGPPPTQIPGVDLRAREQLSLLAALGPLARELPFADTPQPGLRYFYNNGSFAQGDGAVYAAMLRHVRPRRVVEIGAGASTCLLLDVIDRDLTGHCTATVVEPYPAHLRSLLDARDVARLDLVEHRLQDADPDVWRSLRAGDILFIDSSHVAKIGSDVNLLFAEILPSLAPGVLIHLHDIFFPFEYPKAWIMEGRAWNEAYVLRAFLQFNAAFEILLFNSYLATHHREALLAALPMAATDPGGSIWLRRV